ncbi:MAG: hypothetical protein H0U03_03295 [Actinobacteria bacterium]|nr:hypothetical protein [Actinomycetota bacterium]
MEAKGTRAILAAGVLLAALAAPAAAAGGHVSVQIVPQLDLDALAGRGAVGLMVPGKGPTVSREEALELLDREALSARECRRACTVRILLSLPPPGDRHNVRRYPVAVLGAGYRGLLVSDSTRIPGLVSISDIVPTARALERGEEPVIEARAESDAPARLARLDRRLDRAHDSRDPATIVLVGLVAVFGGLAALLRSPLFGKAAVLTAPALLLISLGLSSLGIDRRWIVASALAILGAAAALAGGATLRRRGLGVAFACLFAVYLVVLAAWPEVNSLAAIGPHPDGGGRFYGVTNQMQTLLLAPALLAGALLGRRWLLPVALLALFTVGASRTGADGGGTLVLIAAFLALAAGLLKIRVTWLRAAGLAVSTLAGGIALIAIDAALGGSTHVTRAVTGGPDSLADAVGHRLDVSFQGVTGSWYVAAIVLVSLAALIWLATRRPRSAVLDALLVGLAVSLVVNDTPVDVAGFGALSCAAVWVWQRADHDLTRL